MMMMMMDLVSFSLVDSTNQSMFHAILQRLCFDRKQLFQIFLNESSSMNFFNYPYLGREHLKGLNEYKVRGCLIFNRTKNVFFFFSTMLLIHLRYRFMSCNLFGIGVWR